MWKGVIGVFVGLLLLASWAVRARAQDASPESVVKTVCISALGYDELEPIKRDLLAQAKREAANELFGELITAATTVDNLVVTADQIRVQSTGLIRLEGSVTYANGDNLAEACATITAYVTAQDRAQFVPETVSGRRCVTDPALSVRQVRAKAEEGARVQALVDYDSRLEQYAAEAVTPLLRRVEYAESGLLAGTDTYCATVTGAVTPIEVISFLSLDGNLLVLDDVTPSPAATRTPLPLAPTRTPSPARTVTTADVTATAFAVTREAFVNRTPTFTPTSTPTPDSTNTAVALMIDVLATAEAAPHHVYDLWVNPTDDAVYVYVPAGGFTMGSGDGDEDERPVHTVYLDAYWIMRTEVTNGQYARCVRAGVCTAPNNSVWKDVRYVGHPVTTVDWNQASVYAEWVGGSLPTEAQWEKACRGDDLRPYPWGDQEPAASLLNFDGSGIGATSGVGSYPQGASSYGALDMAGNVREWTADWYASGYYGQSPEQNPPGPGSGQDRVLRGGAFSFNESYVRCASRNWYFPLSRLSNVGFRVVSPGF